MAPIKRAKKDTAGPSKTPKDRLRDRHEVNIDRALAFQDHNNWKNDSARTMALFTGHYAGIPEKDSKYIVSTYYNLINLILPSLYFKQPFVQCISKKKNIYVKGKDDKYVTVNGERAGVLLSAALNDAVKQIGIEEEQIKVLQDVLTRGWGVLKVGIDSKTASIPHIEYQAKRLFAQRIAPIDFLYDPMAANINEASFVCQRLVVTKESLEENKNIKAGTIEQLQTASLDEGTKKEEIKRELKGTDDIDAKEDNPDELVTIYEYHDLRKNKIFTYGKGKDALVSLWERDNPHKMEGAHFVVLKFTGDPDEWSGVSMLLSIEDQALAVNTIVDLMIKHFQRFAGVLVAEEGAISSTELDRFENSSQGDILFVNSGALQKGQVDFKNPTSMGQEYFSGLITFNQLMDRVLGIPDFQRGGGRTRKTATENVLESGDANVRRDFFVQFVKRFVLQVARKLIALIQQYYTETEVVKITGEFTEWPTFTKEIIQGEYELDLDLTEMIRFNQAQAQGLIQGLNVVMQNEEAKAYIAKEVNIGKLVETVMRGFGVDFAQVKKPKPMIREEYDPYQENEKIREGKRIPDPLPNEAHSEHLAIHEPAAMEFQAMNMPEQAYEMKRHMDMHGWMSGGQENQAVPSIMPQQQTEQPVMGMGMEGMAAPISGGGPLPQE